MVSLGDTLSTLGPQVGLLLFAAYQLYWPLWETRLQKLIHSISADVREEVQKVRRRVEEIDKKQTAHIQVTRATARDTSVSDERVDEHLVKNGVSMDYFFTDEDTNGPSMADGGHDLDESDESSQTHDDTDPERRPADD